MRQFSSSSGPERRGSERADGSLLRNHRSLQGLLVKVDRWGKSKLAYLIRKQSKGTYVLLDYAGSSAVVSEMERNFKIDDHVLKYMTILKNENVSLQDLEKEATQSKEKAEGSTAETSGAPSETRAPLTVVSPASLSAQPAAQPAVQPAAQPAAEPAAERQSGTGGVNSWHIHHREAGRPGRIKSSSIGGNSADSVRTPISDRLQEPLHPAGLRYRAGQDHAQENHRNCAGHQLELTVAIKRARTPGSSTVCSSRGLKSISAGL